MAKIFSRVSDADAVVVDPSTVEEQVAEEQAPVEEQAAEETVAEEQVAEEQASAEEPVAEEQAAEEPAEEQAPAEESAPKSLNDLTDEEREMIVRARQRKELTQRLDKMNAVLKSANAEDLLIDVDSVSSVDEALVKLVLAVATNKKRPFTSDAQTSGTADTMTLTPAAAFFRGLD